MLSRVKIAFMTMGMALVVLAPSTAQAQDKPPIVSHTPADAIATEVTGEPDACARRELIVSQYAEGMAGQLENPTAADLAQVLRIASDMYQSSYDLARPRGAPVIDFATACPAIQPPSLSSPTTGADQPAKPKPQGDKGV